MEYLIVPSLFLKKNYSQLKSFEFYLNVGRIFMVKKQWNMSLKSGQTNNQEVEEKTQ